MSAVSVVGLGGCVGGNNENSGDGETPDPLSVGESATYGGLQMTVTETRTVSEYTDTRKTHTPEPNATFFITHIRIENVGDTEIFFPERGGDTQLEYKGEEASDEFPTQPFEVGGETLRLYSDSAEEQGADTGAFPDTVVEGWAVFELPKGFERSDTSVTIRYSDTSADSRTFRWQLS